MEISPEARSKFRHMANGDDARDLALDYDADLDAQYADYVSECHEAGIVPLPR